MSNYLYDFSIVVTCFNEEKTIDEFITRLVKTIQKMKIRAEIILVNDGSRDQTWLKLQDLFRSNTEIKQIINFFRNSGQGPAMTAGVVNSQGRDFIFIDSDLQIDPEDLELVMERYNTGLDAIVGVRKQRIDSFFRKMMSKMANVVLRKVSKSSHPDLGCNLKIINGKLVRSFNYSDKKAFDSIEILGKAGTLGAIDINHHARRVGKSGWKFFNLLKFFIDKLLQLNDQLFIYLGITMILLGILIVMRLIISFYFDFSILNSITSGILFNFIALGFLLVSGLLICVGEYIIRIYKFIQGNPIYVIKEIIKRD
ncbi:MAG: glycosyltransferase [Bdellovibrionaceae bacterium]|nr:glycosyltransferase [Pseudobdellovibrionaceae bacterium]